MTARRISTAQALMRSRGIDALLLSVGSDLPYLAGYRAMPLERITALVVPVEGDPVLFVPELEAPRVETTVEVRGWGETDDPFSLISAALPASGTVGVGDQMWSAFLIAFQELLPGARFVDAEPVLSPLRIIKDEAEIDALREAARAADAVADQLDGVRFSGRSERDLSREIGERLIAAGHESVSFAIVASGPNGASPHHDAGDRVMQPGDAIVADFGGRLRGYGSDTTRMYSIGSPPDGFAEAFNVLTVAQQAAVDAVAPGATAGSVDATARSIIADAGYGEFFIHRTGHGIGLDAHEPPYIVEGNTATIEPGMAFSIEPGIYVPGRWGMRIEDIVVATDHGVERLNLSSRSLRVVE